MASNPNVITILPPNAPIANEQGYVTTPWYRFFVQTKTVSDASAAGAVTTASGSGLQGGGIVANGVSLSIANQGVTDARLRNSLATSVMGRAFNSVGAPADIVANADNRVLSREGGQLAFRAFINGVSIGPTTQAAGDFTDLRCDTFRIDVAPTASATATTHSIPININGTTYYMRLSATP